MSTSSRIAAAPRLRRLAVGGALIAGGTAGALVLIPFSPGLDLLLVRLAWLVLVAQCFVIAYRYPSLGLVALALMIPLEISRAWLPVFQVYDPRSGNWFSWFYLEDIIEWVLILVWVIKATTGRRIRYADQRLLLGIALFSLYTMFSALRGPLEVSRYSLYIQIKYLSLVLAVAYLVRSVRVVGLIRNTILISGIALAGLTIHEFASGTHLWFPGSFYETGVGGDVWATFADRNNLARYMIVVLVFALCSIADLGWKAWIVVAGAFGTIVLSQSRSGLLVSGLAILLVFLYQRRSLTYVLVSALLMIIVVSIVFSLSGGVAATTTTQVLNISGERGWLARSALILAGLGMFSSHPIIGVGLDQFPVVFRATFGTLPGFEGLANSHTSIVTLLAEMGMIGLILMAYIFYQAWKLFKDTVKSRSHASHAIALWISCLVVLVMSQVEGRLLGDANLWFFLALLFSASNLSNGRGIDESSPHQ